MKEYLKLYNSQDMGLYDFICMHNFSQAELKELLLSFIFYFENDEKMKYVIEDTIERL